MSSGCQYKINMNVFIFHFFADICCSDSQPEKDALQFKSLKKWLFHISAAECCFTDKLETNHWNWVKLNHVKAWVGVGVGGCIKYIFYKYIFCF